VFLFSLLTLKVRIVFVVCYYARSQYSPLPSPVAVPDPARLQGGGGERDVEFPGLILSSEPLAAAHLSTITRSSARGRGTSPRLSTADDNVASDLDPSLETALAMSCFGLQGMYNV